jgi:hypothetical protein
VSLATILSCASGDEDAMASPPRDRSQAGSLARLVLRIRVT